MSKQSDIVLPQQVDDSAEQLEREELFAQLREMKEAGVKFRMPNSDTKIEKLRKRVAELEKAPALGTPPTKKRVKTTKRAADSPPPPSHDPFAIPEGVDYDPEDDEEGYDDEDEDDEDQEGGDKQPTFIPYTPASMQYPQTMFHTMYYTSMASVGLLAEQRGYKGMSQLGPLVMSNKPIMDPLLWEMAVKYKWTQPVLPLELRVALLTGTMAASCYIRGKENADPRAMAAVSTCAAFFSLNLMATPKSDDPGGPSSPAF